MRGRGGRAFSGSTRATFRSARGRRMRAAGEMAMWPCSSAQPQNERMTDVTLRRVWADRTAQRSMTMRRSSTETSVGSRWASVRLMRARIAS
jgi:hypothetical protein